MQCCMRRPTITPPDSRGGHLDIEPGANTPKLYTANGLVSSLRACSENTMFSLNPQSEWEACPLARRWGNPPFQNEQHETGRWPGYGRHRVVEDGSYLVDPASSICLSQRLSHACLSTHGRYSETANGSLNQLWFLWSLAPLLLG